MWRLVLAALILMALGAFCVWWWMPSAAPEPVVATLPESLPDSGSRPSGPRPPPAAVRFQDVWDGAPAARIDVTWSADDGASPTVRTTRTDGDGQLQVRGLQPGTAVRIRRVEPPWSLLPRRAAEPPLERHVVRRIQVEIRLLPAGGGRAAKFESARLEVRPDRDRPGTPQAYDAFDVELRPEGSGRVVGIVPRLPGAVLHVITTAGARGEVALSPSVGEWSEERTRWTVECRVR